MVRGLDCSSGDGIEMKNNVVDNTEADISDNQILLPELQCKRCSHKWNPRTTNKPKVCPKCNSPYWDKERSLKR